ncbi:N-acetyllactosaminide beta-1 [Tropilaelaps mercedesae]|uniref:Beta-1,4-glucuronyltransferase 1 n=1 Tax=Tropilaelaps mercedesae TaxID=418985 RepID=A0A1V9X148_9ACAR|nr:N-acetyllactosaminide beta-1 [Tropilaelaps mercedesae]
MRGTFKGEFFSIPGASKSYRGTGGERVDSFPRAAGSQSSLLCAELHCIRAGVHLSLWGRAWRRRIAVVVAALIFVALVNTTAVLIRATDPNAPNPWKSVWSPKVFPFSEPNVSTSTTSSMITVGFDMPTFNFRNVKLDRSRRYRIFEDVVTAEDQESTAKSLVCLATLSSLDRLIGLLDIAHNWDGPVSVAVSIRSTAELQALRQFIRVLGICSDAVRLNFAFHFLLPVNGSRIDLHAKDIAARSSETSSCVDQLKALLPSPPPPPLKTTRAFDLIKLLFPQNHLRNIARDGCERMGAKYFFLTDIDIVPKPALASQLNEFLHERKPRREVFVVPTYEMPEHADMPQSKADLLKMVRAGFARPFHKVVFIHNQYATNHDLWERLAKKTPDQLKIAYKVTNYEFFYEPFYVAPFSVPRHDERFIGYGFTRNTQVYEMHLANFEFQVLDEAFAVHRGIQTRKSRGFWREKQNVQNRRLFLQFKKDMVARHGNRNITIIGGPP